MVEEKVSPRTIKVVDRRRFTTEGDPRDDVTRATDSDTHNGPSPAPGSDPVPEAPAAPPPPGPPRPATDEAGSAKTTSEATRETSQEFVELIATLAQQAEMLIVGAEGLPAEPDHARRIIDYLAALEAKTSGNLSPEEQQILTNVVFQLRSLFLQRQ